jgi:aspartyl-tRNA(Asn)/glutamyl-tRNA(Gln) amidotransferase subunit A
MSGLSLVQCAQAIAGGQLTATQTTQAALDRIAGIDPHLHAFVHVDRESALRQAEAVDRARSDGSRLGPLAGVPIAVKDMIAVRGMPLTAASRMLAGYVPPVDATVVERLRRAGAVILGKTNQDEFAMGSSNERSAVGPVHNPWHRALVPGGSSGGAAAAVAARLGYGGLGTDTGGSVRQPAALCGVVGLKPTYGRVSRLGVVAFASSLDQVGPIARTVRDAARLQQVIGGHDPGDSTSDPRPQPDYEASLTGECSGVRVGVPAEYLDEAEGLDPGIRLRVTEALDVLRGLGATLVPQRLPHVKHCIATYYLICTAEASANLQRYDGVRFGHRGPRKPGEALVDLYARSRGEGFGPEVKRRILLGTFGLASGYHDAYYKRACQVRRLIHDDFADALRDCDVIVGPTSPVCAWPLGAKTEDPLAMYLMDIFTIPANLAGLPGISVPAPLHPTTGLPVGLQFVGRAFGEDQLLRVADAYARAAGTESMAPSDIPAGQG